MTGCSSGRKSRQGFFHACWAVTSPSKKLLSGYAWIGERNRNQTAHIVEYISEKILKHGSEWVDKTLFLTGIPLTLEISFFANFISEGGLLSK